jgi:hypothetical protein
MRLSLTFNLARIYPTVLVGQYPTSRLVNPTSRLNDGRRAITTTGRLQSTWLVDLMEFIPMKERSLMPDLPIVCTLGPAALKARREDLLGGSEDVLGAIARVIDLERQCCRFLRFQITIEPDGGPLWLECTCPPGTREFLDGMLNL